jgi:hypothetical protein
MINTIPDFKIKAGGKISQASIHRGLLSFHAVSDYILHLKFGRNPDKEDLSSVFRDNCATCSTKHALLKELATENGFMDLKLILGIIKMTKTNTPEVSKTLSRHKLDFLPEAHNYLKFQGEIFDFTKPEFMFGQNEEERLIEMEIRPNQITDYKVSYHKAYLAEWLRQNPQIPYTESEIWEIREQCIRDLSDN